MTAIAERVHTRQDEIALIESRIVELPDEAIVEVTLEDGRKLKGLVTVRPTIQTFRDADGREGCSRGGALGHPSTCPEPLDAVRDRHATGRFAGCATIGFPSS